jgi:hypothetical protein
MNIDEVQTKILLGTHVLNHDGSVAELIKVINHIFPFDREPTGIYKYYEKMPHNQSRYQCRTSPGKKEIINITQIEF